MTTAQEAARMYGKHGWPTVPLRPNTKILAAEGFTGRHEAVMTAQDWAVGYADAPNHPPGAGGWNIAIRLPDGVIALDVDAYHGGEETMQALVSELGGLPPTAISSGRQGPGGHLFYRVPEGTRLANSAGPGVDVLQHHHRYSVVWPSVVDDRKWDPNTQVENGALRTYSTRLPEGMLGANGVIPPPRELPELPAGWLAYLTKGASSERQHADQEAVVGFQALVDRRDGPEPIPCAEMVRAMTDYAAALAGGGSRYDAMVAASLRVACLGAEGHPGMDACLAEIEMEYATAVMGEQRDTAAEFQRASDGALEIAAGRVFAQVDPCTVLAGAPALPHGEEEGAEPLEFLPIAGTSWTDRHVAASALVFAGRWMRPCDTGAWLSYAGDRWRYSYCVGSEGAEGAVSTAVAFIRPGDPESQDPLEGARAGLYKRMNGTGSAGVYTQARKLYRSEAMPLPLLEADKLDADPEHLWAGGQCWDLRASSDRPTLAEDVDPGTVHTHSAGPQAPELKATPLWDAFLSAVWPDPEFRAWALRVLGITITGYADRALPILYGEPGTGKTSVPTILGQVLGTYYLAADPRLLSARDVHASVVLALKGVRVAFIDEAPRDTFSVTERLKMLTGGGQLTGNRMRSNPEVFNPTHSLILTSNDDPRVGDPAVRSRVRPMECAGDPVAVRTARRAMRGPAWTEEVPGVLANLMAEAGRWLADPDSGQTRETETRIMEQLALEADPVALWVSEETIPEGWTSNRELWSAYATWAAMNGIAPKEAGNAVTFGRRLGQLVTEAGRRKFQGDRQSALTVRSGGAHTPGPSAPQAPDHVPPTPAHTPETTPTQGAHTPQGADQGADQNTHVPPAKTTSPLGETQDKGHMGQMDGGISSNTNSSYIEGAGGPSAQTQAPMSEPSAPSAPSPVSEGSGPSQPELPAILAPLPAIVVRTPAGPHTTPVDMGTASEFLATWKGRDVTLDVEHTGYPIGHNEFRLKTIQLGDENVVVVLDAADASQVALGVDTLDGASEITCHAAQADLLPVAFLAQENPGPWWAKVTDTAILAWLEDPAEVASALTKPDYSLKGLSTYVIPKRLGIDPVAPGADKDRAKMFREGKWLTKVSPTTPVKKSGWAQVPVDDPRMVTYAAGDVLDTAALRRALATPDPQLMARERHVQTVVAKVSEVGVPLDGPYVAERLERHEAKLAELGSTLAEAHGLADPGKDAQVAAVLVAAGYELPLTPKTQKPSVAADALEALPSSPLVDALLAWREQETILSTYLRNYHAQVVHGDGRLRPTVQTLGAATTGRMSCVRPNLQNVPREGGIRGCIVADPGYSIISADFSGVELRVFAALSQDTHLMDLIANGLDIHKLVAQTVWGPEATKANRYQAKRGVFGWLYGGGLGTIARQLDGNPETARKVIAALTMLAPAGVRWSDAVRDQVKNQRMPYWRHPSGRLTHLPHRLPHKAVNLCIQSTARELLVDALLEWDRGPWSGSVVLPIHDEVVAMVPTDQAEAALAHLVECMATELQGVAIAAEPSTPSQRWQDAA